MDRYLQQFLAVAELESISKAAEFLHLTQPTVSANLQRLENSLGVKLYQRQSRGIRLTPFGEVVLKHCRQMQQSQQRLRAALQDLRQREMGQIRLGCGDAWWELFVRDALGQYLQEHRAALTLSLGNHLDLMAQLLAGQLDCFIGHQIPGLARRQPVAFTPLFSSVDAHYVGPGHPLLAPRDTPLSEADIEQYPLLAVTPDRETLLSLLDDPQPKQRESRRRQTSTRPLFEVDTLAASIDLLKISQAVMPYPKAMQTRLARQQIQPIPYDDEQSRGTIGLYRHREQSSAATERLVAYLFEAAARFSDNDPAVDAL